GLATLSVQRRRREIGIRKVLGASVGGVMATVLRDFVVLVGVAAVVAAPLAYLGMRRWLDDFAFRIDLTAVPFVGAAALALVIAVCTVGYHALRAATLNPVRALRQE
ncbi:MAG: FtsX-like permease family protein, partial [Bacteroidota bacterium]